MEKISNIALENKIFSNRMLMTSLFILIITLVLILRLYNLQISSHDYYAEEALGNQMRTLPITPLEGRYLIEMVKLLPPTNFRTSLP